MGQLAADNSALINPDSGRAMMIGNPSQVLNASQNYLPKPDLSSLGIGTPQEPQPMPQIGKPSFIQAATAGESVPGEGNAMSPGLSKAGKLAVLLTSGLKGALAGHAAQEQATIQSGGRRAGGAGIGFEAGLSAPYSQAMPAQQLAQAQAQTALTRAQSDMVQTPYGMMPAALARFILPAQIRAGAQENVAQTNVGGRQAVAQTQAQSAQNVANINERFMAIPNVGLFDTQSRTVIPGTQQGIMVTPEIAQEYELPQQFIGKPMSLANLSSLENGQRFAERPVEGANGPALVNTQPNSPNFGRVTPLGLGNPNMGRGVQVADPNNPGNTIYTTMGNAINSGAQGTQSASVQVPRQAAKSEVPSKMGDQRLAFNTALQHADLLEQALGALSNGDTRALNSLKNSFKTQFGSPDVTNFQAIANAYNHEVTSVISKGHLTDKEVATGGAQLPANASPAQIVGALHAYRQLMQSKMNMLDQQKNNAIRGAQGRPIAPQGQSSGGFKPF